MNDTREVRFDQWCSKCEYADITEDNMSPKDPCWDCLHEPMNIDSHKPFKFKEADNKAEEKIKVESYTVSEK